MSEFTIIDWVLSMYLTFILRIFFFFSSIIIELKQQNCVMENQILQAISYIKNISEKSLTAENFFNHISKTSASNIDLSFVNETITELIAENKINDNFKIIEEPQNRDLIQSTDDAQTLVMNDKLNETLEWSPTALQLVDEKELGILIIAAIATLKRKNKKCGPKELFKLVKDSVETGLTINVLVN